MAERSNPLHRLLTVPAVYLAVQHLMRGDDSVARDFIKRLAAKPGDRVLDIGCGPAAILNDLPSVEYIGYEPNAAYVEHARRTFGDRGQFHAKLFGEADVESIGPVDIVIVRAVLHHLSDNEARKLFSLLARALRPSGRALTLDPLFIPRQNPIARLLIGLDRGLNVRAAEEYRALALPFFTEVTGDIVHRAFPPYTYWFMTTENAKVAA